MRPKMSVAARHGREARVVGRIHLGAGEQDEILAEADLAGERRDGGGIVARDDLRRDARGAEPRERLGRVRSEDVAEDDDREDGHAVREDRGVLVGDRRHLRAVDEEEDPKPLLGLLGDRPLDRLPCAVRQVRPEHLRRPQRVRAREPGGRGAGRPGPPRRRRPGPRRGPVSRRRPRGRRRSRSTCGPTRTRRPRRPGPRQRGTRRRSRPPSCSGRLARHDRPEDRAGVRHASPTGTTASSVSSFVVSVPVLSRQRTSTLLSDSIAFDCCTSAPNRLIRTAPSAYAMAMETNSPLGMSPARIVACPTASPGSVRLMTAFTRSRRPRGRRR